MKASNVTTLSKKPSRDRASSGDFRLSALDQLSQVDRQELVLELPIDRIDADPDQPRKEFTEATLSELADNLRLLGQIQPVEVREAGDRYVLIDGERRWRAAQRIPMTTLRALLKFDPGTPDGVRDRQFAANFHRDAMALADQARYLQARLDALGSAAAVGHAIGLSVPRILNIVKTLRADGPAAVLRDSGLTKDADTIGAVVEVQKADPVAAQTLVAEALDKGKITRKDAQEAARMAKGKAPRPDKVDADDDQDQHASASSRDFNEGRGSGARKSRPAEPKLVVLLTCDGTDEQQAQWNKRVRQYGRARLSLVASTTQPGCVLVEFGDTHSEPMPAVAIRIKDTVHETDTTHGN
jgi:ParB/RepB/Spo0J family partition protein